MMKRNHNRTAQVLLALCLSFLAAVASAQSRKGYALWCSDVNTMYFIQADSKPATYQNHDVDAAWEINDMNLRGGVAAPAWIVAQTSSGRTVTRDLTTVVIEPSFRFVTPSGCYSWFHGCTKLKTVTGLSYINTSRVGYMNKMFFGCTDLETIDFVGVDMVPVVNTTMMFYGCSKLKTIRADEAWGPAYSASMFTGCEQLVGSVAYDPEKVDGTMATSTNGYFTTGSYIYALSLDNHYKMLFLRTTEEIVAGDTYRGMTVEEVIPFEQFIRDPGGSYMWSWSGNRVVREVAFEPSFRNVTLSTLEHFFKGLDAVTSIDGMEYLNTSEVTSMRGMFEDCTGLTSIDVSSMDMGNVTDVSRMFSGCSNVVGINLTGVVLPNVTTMESMFAGCGKLASVDLSYLDTRKVTNMGHLFDGCRSLSTLALLSLNTSAVTDMQGMFKGCAKVKELDVNNFDVSHVTDVSEMFRGCSSLQTIFCENSWSVATSDNMFLDCESLSGAIAYDPEKVDCAYANPETGYFYSELNPPTYDPQGRFIVSSAAKWEEFAGLVNSGERSDLNAVLTKDVDLGDSQVMVGTEDHPYTGTFEGNGRTLNIAYVTTEGDTPCAPFPYVQGCTIRNLHVTGTITAGHQTAAGLIGTALASSTSVTISKCWSSVVFNSSIEGSGHLGGFVAEHWYNAPISMTNCLFDGAILGENTSGCGGFFGYVRTSNSLGVVEIRHSLMNGTMQFDTAYKNREASGPFYGFYKYIATSEDYSSKMNLQNNCYYTTTDDHWSTLQQGSLFSNNDIQTLCNWLNDTQDDWGIVDGKPALLY